MFKQHSGPLAIVLAAFLWSLDGLLRRQLYSLSPTVVVFWEHLLGLIILLPFLLKDWQEYKKLTKKQWLSIGLVSLLSGALGTIFYTAALGKIQFIPFSVVVLLQQLQPIFAITAASLLLKEPITLRFSFLTVLALVAAYMVSFPELRVNLGTGSGTAMAALLAIGAAASWGASTAFSKYSLQNTSFVHITGIRFALTPIFALLIGSLLGHTSQLGMITTMQWQYLVAITFSTGLVALAIYYYGLQRVPASRATLLELTWPISAIFIGYMMGDRLTLTQFIGSVALLGIMGMIARDAEAVQALKLKKK